MRRLTTDQTIEFFDMLAIYHAQAGVTFRLFEIIVKLLKLILIEAKLACCVHHSIETVLNVAQVNINS